MSSDQKVKLSHPILGVRQFPLVQAKAIMDLGSANGGWEWYKEDSKSKAKKVVKSIKKNLPKGTGNQKSVNKSDANHGDKIAGDSKESKDK